jgi:hypothetical protein
VQTGIPSSFLIHQQLQSQNNTSLPTKQPFKLANMSGLMDKAKDSLSGNKAAQGFADKQVTSRSYPPHVPLRSH